MRTIPASAATVIALAMLTCSATDAVAITQSSDGYAPIGFRVYLAEQNNIESVPEFLNLTLGFYQQVVVRHAGTLAISRVYVRRLPTMASTNDARRSRLCRFTFPSFSLKVNSSMYRERCLALA